MKVVVRGMDTMGQGIRFVEEYIVSTVAEAIEQFSENWQGSAMVEETEEVA